MTNGPNEGVSFERLGFGKRGAEEEQVKGKGIGVDTWER